MIFFSNLSWFWCHTICLLVIINKHFREMLDLTVKNVFFVVHKAIFQALRKLNKMLAFSNLY